MCRKTKSRLCIAASVLAIVMGGSVSARADDAATLKVLQDQINALQKQLAKIQAAQAKSAKAAATSNQAAAPVAAPAASFRAGPFPSAPFPSAPPPAGPPPAGPFPAGPPPVAFAPPPTARGVAAPSGLHGIIKAKTGVDMTLGGYLDVTSLYRTKNESADVGSNFNTMIPFNNAPNAHQGEFRETARATRLSLLATGNPDADTKLTGYVETDFQGAATTSTSTQTNGYAPRIRQGFGEYENNAWGLHVLGGQAWSLVTTDKAGMNALDESIPIVIESGYLPGFNFTRGPQVRVVKDFDDKKLWLGVSAETPQAETNGVCTSGSTPSNSPSMGGTPCSGLGTTLLNASSYTSSFSSSSVTTDIAPDVVVKAAYDPGWGHYEVFGLARFFHDTTGTNIHSNYVTAGGGGAGAILPVVPKMVDVQANMMVGQGIGRYSAAQMPDFSIAPNGSLKPLSEYTAMLGVVGHPTPTWDTYLYAGLEQEFRHNVNGLGSGSGADAYGYGNFAVHNDVCNTGTISAAGATSACFAQTSSIWQITPGVWHRVYDGNYGKMQVGLQDSWTRRNAFSDSHGNAPHGIENITMLSFRYYPF